MLSTPKQPTESESGREKPLLWGKGFSRGENKMESLPFLSFPFLSGFITIEAVEFLAAGESNFAGLPPAESQLETYSCHAKRVA